jgi:hypothetical protein
LSAGFIRAVAFFVLAVGIAPLFFAGQVATSTSVDPTTAFVQWSLVAYSGAHLSRIVFLGLPNWLDLSLYGYIYTWLALAPFIQLFAGENPLKMTVGPEQLQAQALIVLCGLVAYDVGALVARRRRRPTKRSEPPNSHLYSGPSPVRPRRVLQIGRVKLFTILSLALTPFFINALGGLSALFASRDARYESLQSAGLYTEESKGGGAWLSSIASVLPFLALYSLIVILVMIPALRKSLALHGLVVLAVVANLILNNPISSSRFWFLVVVLSIVYASTWAQSPTGVRTIATLFVAGSVVVFPYLDLFRNSDATLRVRSVTEFFTQKTDYDSLVQVGNAWMYVQTYGLDFGRQMSGVVGFFIPRSVWADKPIDTGSVLARYINYPNENLSAPLWGELFINYSWLGVALGFAVVGYLAQLATTSYLVALETAVVTRVVSLSVFMYPVLAVYLVLILRGSLLQAMGKLVVLIVVMLLFTGRSRKAVLTPSTGMRSRVQLNS